MKECEGMGAPLTRLRFCNEICSLKTISSCKKPYTRLLMATEVPQLLPLLTRYFISSLGKEFFNDVCMEFNILFTVLKPFSILLKPLSYIIYAETLPHVISYVSTGFCFVLLCICLWMKLEVHICNHYLGVGLL